VLNAPKGFSLGDVPADVKVGKKLQASVDAVLLFVASQAELKAGLPKAAEAVGHDGLLWLAYPKTSSGVETGSSVNSTFGLETSSGWLRTTNAAAPPASNSRAMATPNAISRLRRLRSGGAMRL